MLQLYTHTSHMRKNMAAAMSERESNFYYFVQFRQKTEMTSLSTNHLSSRFKLFKDGRRKARDYIFVASWYVGYFNMVFDWLALLR